MQTHSIRSGRRGGALLVLLAAVIAFGAIAVSGSAEAADHGDAPALAGDGQADINDVYAFRSLENNDNHVVAVTVNPLTAPPQNAGATFGNDVTYNIHVDNTGDLVADATVSVTFSGDTFTVNGLGDPITGSVTPGNTSGTAAAAIITDAGGIKVFAGQRDDPFFFDLVGFNNFVAGPFTPANGLRPAGETPSDTLAGLNVSAIVIELPITALTGAATSDTGVIKAWASTSRGGVQIDRMAIPAINTALIPSDQKDAFNAGSPATDEADFRATGQATIEGLRAAVAPFLGDETGGPLGDLAAADVAGALIPDIVTIDFANAVAFPNGRQLTDDVIDAALGIVLNRGGAAGIADAIGANDKAFLGAFPYLAAPHQPAQVGPPPTGSGLAFDEGGSGFAWSLWLPLAAAAVIAASGAAWMARRSR